MDQPPVTGTGPAQSATPEGQDQPLPFFPADIAGEEERGNDPFVAVVRTREQLAHWLGDPAPGLQWLQVEGLLDDPEAWAPAARGDSDVPLDVVLADPGAGFSHLYRLVDVLAVRDVRVTMPATPGFLKALRLAASIHLPVRLHPGQPDRECLEELGQAADFYLHDPMIETPVEFFHSALAGMRGAEAGSLWMILEEDPAVFLHHDASGNPVLPMAGDAASPAAFVETRLAALIASGAECAQCPWQQLCRGYFKQPDPAYSCEGVVQLLDRLRDAADEIALDLARGEKAPSQSVPPPAKS